MLLCLSPLTYQHSARQARRRTNQADSSVRSLQPCQNDIFRQLTGLVPGDDQANLSVTDSAATFFRLALRTIMETAGDDHMSNLRGVTFWSHYSKTDVMKLPTLYYERITEKITEDL